MADDDGRPGMPDQDLAFVDSGLVDVHRSRAAGEDVGWLAVVVHDALGGRGQQPRLDVVRRGRGIILPHQRHAAAYYGCGHAGAAEFEVPAPVVVDIRRERRLQEAVHTDADQAVAGRDDVGLQDVVDRRRSATAVGGQHVVAQVVRLAGVGGAHGDDQGVVSGAVDAAVLRCVAEEVAHCVIERRAPPPVAGRHDHDHVVVLPERFHGLAEGISLVALGHRMADGQIGDSQRVVSAFLYRQPLQGVDDVGDGAAAVRAEDLHVVEHRPRRHARELALPRSRFNHHQAGAGDEPRQMGAVPVEVLDG